MTRIIIQHDDFKNLIRDKIIKIDDVEVILSDIGYAKMCEDMVDAWDGKPLDARYEIESQLNNSTIKRVLGKF